MSLRTIPAEVVQIVASHGAPFKELHFGEGVFAKFLEKGEGAATIRAGERDFEPGKLVVALCAEGDRFLIQITSCEYYSLRHVPGQDLLDDGFSDWRDACRGLRRFYPELNGGSVVSSIRFKVLARIVGGEDG